jgi:flagellar biosynthesis GTPase FlhF
VTLPDEGHDKTNVTFEQSEEVQEIIIEQMNRPAAILRRKCVTRGVEMGREMKDKAEKCQVEVKAEAEAEKVDGEQKLEALKALMKSFEKDEVKPKL